MPPTLAVSSDWDYQPRLGQSRGHHVSRGGELGAVADFVERRDEGSLLVVGRRGSGKTSLVIAAVNDAVRRSPGGRTIVPVLVRATSIYPGGSVGARQLLEALIRSLRRAAARGGPEGRVRGRTGRFLLRLLRRSPGRRRPAVDGGMRKDLDRIYENATAAKKTSVRSSSTSWTRSLAAGAYLSYAVVPVLLLLGYAWLDEHAWEPAAFGLAAAAALSAMAVVNYRGARRSAVTDMLRHEYGFADMQCDFEEMLQRHAGRHKIVFVLDEFDKAEHDGGIAAVMAPLKMLINQGGALYIFITSPDREGDLGSRQGPNYTVFSERLYVRRSLFEEMDAFIDEIAEERGGGLTDGMYDDLRSYLCYRSRADFFDLYRVIRDRRTETDARGRPVLDAGLDNAETTLANLQRAIRYVYDRKAFGPHSMQEKNDGMLEAMYVVSGALESGHGIQVEASESHVSIGGGKMAFKPHEESAARDLLEALRAEGYLEKSGDAYVVQGTLSSFKGGTHVEEERAFKGAYDALLAAMADLADCDSILNGHGGGFGRDAAENRLDRLLSAVGDLAPVSLPDGMAQCREDLGRPGRPSASPDTLRDNTDAARRNLGLVRTASVGLLARALEKRKGIKADVGDMDRLEDPFDADLGDRDVRVAAADVESHNDSIRLVVVDAQDPAVATSLMADVSAAEAGFNGIAMLLVGDDVPPGLDRACLVVGSPNPAGTASPDAVHRAQNCGAFALALRSPPSPEQLDSCIAAIVKIVEYSLGGGRPSFKKFWNDLSAAASP